MRLPPLALLVAPALLAGCSCDPCRNRCSPCDPCTSVSTTVAAMPNPVAAPSAPAGMPTPPPGAPAGGLVVVGGGGGEAQIVLVGPDGKPITLKAGRIAVNGKPGSGENVRIVQKDGQTILLISEGEEGEEHEGRVGPAAPAGAAKAGASEAAAAAAERGYLGFMPVPVRALSSWEKAYFKVKADHGVVVLNVRPGSPADKAGLKNGDVLLKYAGQVVPDTKSLDPSKTEGGEWFSAAFAKIAGTTRPGKEIEVVVERDGKPVTLKATPVDLAAAKKFAGEEEEDEDDEKNEGAEGPEKGEGPEKAPEKAPAPK